MEPLVDHGRVTPKVSGLRLACVDLGAHRLGWVVLSVCCWLLWAVRAYMGLGLMLVSLGSGGLGLRECVRLTGLVYEPAHPQ